MNSFNQRGLTLVGSIVSLALLTAMILGVTTAVVTSMDLQNRAESRDDVAHYISEIEQSLLDYQICTQLLQGRTLDPSAPMDITLDSPLSGNLSAGTQLTDQITLTSLSLQQEPAPIQMVALNSGTFERRIVSIQAQFTLNNSDGTIGQKEQSYTLPVLVNGNQIIQCNQNIIAEEACISMGGEYESTTRECFPQNQCFLGGQYAQDLYTNAITNAYNCPAGYDAIETGRVGGTTVYTCMRCPLDT